MIKAKILEQKYNEDLFKNKALWADYGLSDTVQERIGFIVNKIPINVDCIIDVGCGNGVITNILNKQFEEVLGIDNSAEALESIEGRSLLSNCDNIAIQDQSFDLVLSSEMIEHLPNDVLERTISEFERISRKYILVSVPNNECLNARFIHCPKCSTNFHTVGHLQSFDKLKLRSLFSDKYTVLEEGEFGKKQLKHIPNIVKIKQKTFGQYFQAGPNAICPNCGNKQLKAQNSNIFTKILNITNHIFGGKISFWRYILLEKI